MSTVAACPALAAVVRPHVRACGRTQPGAVRGRRRRGSRSQPWGCLLRCVALVLHVKNFQSVAEEIIVFPKVLLHDHLDGGLRPTTVAQLAVEAGYSRIPTTEAGVARYFEDRASGSLTEYLEPFEHTLAVMQTPGAIRRVAMESVLDHAANGVVYAELRMAPSLHLRNGLSREDAIEATLEGLNLGEEASGTKARLIVCAMRQSDDAVDVASAAARFLGRGVVGFDLAGPEAGYPASLHRAALMAAAASGLRLTIHAGEGDGVASIKDALECGAERLGHGVRIMEDIDAGDDGLRLGPTADRVLQEGVALEICPKSEVDTKTVRSAADHPIDVLHRAGFATTINTDNTLMSMTDMTREFGLLSTEKGFTSADFRRVTLQAIDAAFCDDETKEHVRSRVAAGYDDSATE